MTYADITLELIAAAMAPGPFICVRGTPPPGRRYVQQPDRERINVVIGLIWIEAELWF